MLKLSTITKTPDLLKTLKDAKKMLIETRKQQLGADDFPVIHLLEKIVDMFISTEETKYVENEKIITRLTQRCKDSVEVDAVIVSISIKELQILLDAIYKRDLIIHNRDIMPQNMLPLQEMRNLIHAQDKEIEQLKQRVRYKEVDMLNTRNETLEYVIKLLKNEIEEEE